MRIKIEKNGETITLGETDNSDTSAFTHAVDHAIPADVLKAAERLGAISAGAAALPRNLADLSIDAALPHFSNEAIAVPVKRGMDAGHAPFKREAVAVKAVKKRKKAKK
jgi:hypothetical protein